MGSIFGKDDGPRWSRGQKFRLSPLGEEAEAKYQADLKTCREQSGRASFDEATHAWAKTFGVHAEDASFLSELRTASRTLNELAESLEGCDVGKSEIKKGLARLVEHKLAELVP